MSNLHYKADGSLDMRYKSSKEYNTKNNQYSLNNNSSFDYFSPIYNNHIENNDLHYKKDGGLDMRYKSSKENNNEHSSPKSHSSIKSRYMLYNDNSLDDYLKNNNNHEFSNNLHYKQDGTLDMRYSTSKAIESSNNDHSDELKSKDEQSSDNLHYKKDGTLDMRFSTSKENETASNENKHKIQRDFRTFSRSKIQHNPSLITSPNDDLHYRKDGNLDMRYSSSKKLATSNNKSLTKPIKAKKRSNSVKIHTIIPFNNNNQLSNELHYKNDGTMDMRYSSSKKARSKSQREKIKPPNYRNDLIIRKDGYLDMRCKACKEYSLLPTDSNDEIIENSPEAVLFRNDHSLNPTPNNDFDFGLIEPLFYSGQNNIIQNVFNTAKHAGKKFLGKMTLYHATSRKHAVKIMESHQFNPDFHGILGAPMIFAEKKQTAIYKDEYLDPQGENALIVANVDMGTALVVEGPNTKLNIDHVRYFNCDSVLCRKTPNSDWEYIVYEPSKIQPIMMIII